MRPDEVLSVLRVKNDASDAPASNETLELIIRNVFTGDDRKYEQVPLAAYLANVESFLRRYVAFPSEHEPVAIALWIAHSHFVDAFDVSPILAVTSAEKRSGKSRVLDCLNALVPRPLRQVTPSEAVVYSAAAERPRYTILIDEADAIFGGRQAEKYEGVRAVLNSGNRKGTPVTRVQWVNRKRVVEMLDVFGAKAIAGIGNLPDTVADRSISIRMRRKAAFEPVVRWREREIPAVVQAVGRPKNPFSGTDGTDGTLPGVGVLPPVELPDELNDRAQDSWETLLVIATLAGGDWYQRGYQAAIALSTDTEATMTTGIKLLADIRNVFDDASVNHLAAHDILNGLYAIEESPWNEWYGKPLTAKGLANLLAAYGITSHRRRLENDRRRYYFRDEFEDAFNRYLISTVSPYRSNPSGPAKATDTPTFLPVPSVPSVPLVQSGNLTSGQSETDNTLWRCARCGKQARSPNAHFELAQWVHIDCKNNKETLSHD